MSNSINSNCVPCPVCNRDFEKELIENHVNRCLFLNTPDQSTSSYKRDSSHLQQRKSPFDKRAKFDPTQTSKQRYEKVSINFYTMCFSWRNKSNRINVGGKLIPYLILLSCSSMNEWYFVSQ